jgi:flagellar basal body-associated protein FliL
MAGPTGPAMGAMPPLPTDMAQQAKPKNSKKGLIIAMVAGLVIVLIMLAVVLIFAKPKTTTTTNSNTTNTNSTGTLPQ